MVSLTDIQKRDIQNYVMSAICEKKNIDPRIVAGNTVGVDRHREVGIYLKHLHQQKMMPNYKIYHHPKGTEVMYYYSESKDKRVSIDWNWASIFSLAKRLIGME